MRFSVVIEAVEKKSQLRRVERTDAYHHGDLRAALLKATGELISESGVEALTLRACARRAGVSHGAPAHHFGNLTGLLTEFAVEGFQKLRAAMDHAASKKTDSALLEAALGYIDYAMKAPEQFRIMWRTELLDGSSTRLQEAASLSRQPLRDALVAALLATHAQVLPEEVLTSRFDLAWCCVHGYACLWVEGRRKSSSLADAAGMLMTLRPVLVSSMEDIKQVP